MAGMLLYYMGIVDFVKEILRVFGVVVGGEAPHPSLPHLGEGEHGSVVWCGMSGLGGCTCGRGV